VDAHWLFGFPACNGWLQSCTHFGQLASKHMLLGHMQCDTSCVELLLLLLLPLHIAAHDY
jgi:hypothetical protein